MSDSQRQRSEVTTLQIIEALREDADTATWHFAYLKSIIDQDECRKKYDNSFSGFAVEAANSAVKQSLIMYCARAWDGNSSSKPVISLRSAVEQFRDYKGLNARWLEWHRDMDVNSRSKRMQKVYEEFWENFESLSGNYNHDFLRVLRTENYAHLARNSLDRQKLEKKGPLPRSTWDDLLGLTEKTILLVGDLGLLFDGLANPYPDRIERALRYCKEFWRVMPVLGEVERIN